jgi:hypothetical protein
MQILRHERRRQSKKSTTALLTGGRGCRQRRPVRLDGERAGVGQRCARPFGERTERLHLWVDSFNESQNGFRCEAPVGGMFLTILTHFGFESSNAAFIGDSLTGQCASSGC